MTVGTEDEPTADTGWVGRSASRSVEITEAAILTFAEVAGDMSPIHMDPGEARRQGFDGPVSHGLLLCSYASGIIGMDLPGPGAVLKSIQCDFHRPAIYPCHVEISVSVTKHVTSVRLLQLAIDIRTHSGERLAVGKAECILKPESE